MAPAHQLDERARSAGAPAIPAARSRSSSRSSRRVGCRWRRRLRHQAVQPHARRRRAPHAFADRAWRAPAPAGARRSARPNIVFVLTDDLSGNLVPLHAARAADAARRARRFSNYFVTDSLCCPSRASILTGRYPHDTGVFDNSPPDGGYRVFHERGEEQRNVRARAAARGLPHGADGQVPQRLQAACARSRDARRTCRPAGASGTSPATAIPEYGYRHEQQRPRARVRRTAARTT